MTEHLTVDFSVTAPLPVYLFCSVRLLSLTDNISLNQSLTARSCSIADSLIMTYSVIHSRTTPHQYNHRPKYSQFLASWRFFLLTPSARLPSLSHEFTDSQRSVASQPVIDSPMHSTRSLTHAKPYSLSSRHNTLFLNPRVNSSCSVTYYYYFLKTQNHCCC